MSDLAASNSPLVTDVKADYNSVKQSGGDTALPYTIEYSPEIGRLLLARRAIQEGEIIIDNEEPLVVGPKQVCLACYRRVDGSYSCSRCGWPLCSESCEQMEGSEHNRIECPLFAERQIPPPISDELLRDDVRIYDCFTPLRMVLDMQRMAEKRASLNCLEDHQRFRKQRGIWHADRKSVANPVLYDWKMADLVNEEELQRACGILEVNAFEVCGEELDDDGLGVTARAVYSGACLMSHNCVPNTACSVDPKNARMTVRAAVDIPAGQNITTSYTFTLDGTQRRRTHLRETKFFDCVCERCQDPTELGSHLSSLTCPKCCNQYSVPEEPLRTSGGRWRCMDEQCGFRMTVGQVHQLLDCLQRKADALNYDDVNGLEAFLDTWTPVLHPNHSILVGVKYYLCHFYGNAPGYHLDEMSPHLLARKAQLCADLLAIARVLEPGTSRLASSLLKELKMVENAVVQTNQFTDQKKGEKSNTTTNTE